MSKKSKLKPAAFVEALVKDPRRPPKTKILVGFPGRAAEPGYMRIYYDPKLESYVDFPDDSVLHCQRLPSDRSALEGYAVWIDAETEVIEVQGVQRRKAKFLSGAIQDQKGAYQNELGTICERGDCFSIGHQMTGVLRIT